MPVDRTRIRCLSAVGLLALFASVGTGARSQTPPASPAPPMAVGGASPLTLDQALSAAFASSPVNRSAQGQLTQAQQRLAQAQAQTRSQITFSSSVGGSNASVIQGPPANESFYTVVNTLTVPLIVGRRAGLAVAQSRQLTAAAREQYEAARRGLTTQVGAGYYDVLRKAALLQIAEDAQATADRQLGDAQKRFRAGDVPELDVLRARVPVATARAGVFGARNTLAAARVSLNGLLGQPLDGDVSVAPAPAPPAALSMTLEQARTKALENSPDVRAAAAAVRAGAFGYEASRHARDPSVLLQASDTRSNDQTGFGRLDNLSATVSFPLGDGGLARAQSAEAAAARDQARAQLEVARQTVLVSVSSAYLTAESSLRQIEAAREAQQIAQTAYDKTTRGYQGGLFPLSDVLAAQTVLTQARIAATQAVYDAAVALFTLTSATDAPTAGTDPQANPNHAKP